MEKAYEKLTFYKNICEIRRLVFEITDKFPKTSVRLVSQMRDAARSAKQNIREGYSKDTVGEFGHGIKISRGSLDELEGDADDCREDGLIEKCDHDRLKDLLGKTKYQMDRYLDSLYSLARASRWKSRFKK